MAGKFVCTNTEPIVETKQGKLRGFCLNGIYTFHGVHYAEVLPYNKMAGAKYTMLGRKYEPTFDVFSRPQAREALMAGFHVKIHSL